MAGEWVSVGALVTEVEKDAAFFEASGGGVTLTGGDIAQQPGFAHHFLQACRAHGIHTAVETSGYARWQFYRTLLTVTDLFLYDLKQMDETRHRSLTGVSNRLIHDNLRRLVDAKAAIIIRLPCIPGMTDSDDNVAATAAFVAGLGLKTIHLLPYNLAAGAKYNWIGKGFSLPNLDRQSVERMEVLAQICRSHGLVAQIGG